MKGIFKGIDSVRVIYSLMQHMIKKISNGFLIPFGPNRSGALCIFWPVLVCFVLTWLSCSSSKKSSAREINVASMVASSDVFNHHFTGFVLFDPLTRQTIFEQNSNKYFTPASNTKILTLLTSLSTFGDTLPSIRYAIKDDKLYIKGMGDPTFLHELWPYHPMFEFLKNTPYQIYLVRDVLQDEIFGPGWAWDDYQESYQVEKSAFPLYGNLVHFNAKDSIYQTAPPYFQSRWTRKPISNPDRSISRPYALNQFVAHDDTLIDHTAPYRMDFATIQTLLADTLARDVQWCWTADLPLDLHWSTRNGMTADSVYAHMMKVSDNFLAEQLLLMVASYRTDTCSSALAIDLASKSVFKDAPDSLLWFDGSGLSRYNLFTPRTLVFALDQLYSKISFDRIKNIFPAGGLNGTIRNWYKGNTGPYVYAKTGSLANNHSLSGYVQTRKNKILIFSFMHSNYTGSVIPIRKEMQRTLEFIRDQY